MDKEIVLNLRLNIDPALEEQLVFLVQAVVDTVTPEGGYEQGDGSRDGSQLADLQWWSPEHGCDSLEHTLDAIRARLITAVTNWYRAVLAAHPAMDGPAVPHQGGREPAAVNNDSIELRVQGMSAWQHIDTAPMDGTEILATDYDAIEIVSWKVYGSDSNWESRYGDVMFPAWWQPLADHPPIPQPPQGEEVES